MLESLSKLNRIRRIVTSGENLGDAAVLKVSLFNAAEEHTQHTDWILSHRQLNFKPIDRSWLATLPTDSFGFQYHRFMKKNKLTPFQFSKATEDVFERYPVTIRYTRIHDMVHVLLGFDTSIAGEVGVYSFIQEQSYNKTLNRAAKTAETMSHLMILQKRKMAQARARGQRLARGAKTLITVPFEDLFEKPLIDLKKDLLPQTCGKAPYSGEINP